MAPFDDDDRDAILERRRRFIAAAFAGFAGASVLGACDSPPATTEPPRAATSPSAPPMPCLMPMHVPPDAAHDAEGIDAAAPQPCLDLPPPVDAGRASDAGRKKREGGLPLPCLTPYRLYTPDDE